MSNEKMRPFERAEWIWLPEGDSPDTHGEFFGEVTLGSVESALFRLSVDGDYALFVNGSFAASCQYPDYEHYKIYDELDLTPFLKEGKNSLRLLVWHIGGGPFSRFKAARAGVIYELLAEGEAILVSGEDTLCRKSPAYADGLCKVITSQLGYSFRYDAEREDCDTPKKSAVRVEKGIAPSSLFPRPCEKQRLGGLRRGVSIACSEDKRYHLLDLGCETVGLPSFTLRAEKRTEVSVRWGEHIADGGVRYQVGGRDFSFQYICPAGEHSFTDYMLRLGARYLEFSSDEPIEIARAGIIPQYYPVAERPFVTESELDRRIYRLCLDTLSLCMMEHYVDCPWREQSLYAFDSRNQMLAGYYAFEAGNREYVRSNLKLMSEDRRPDGFLSICFPCDTPLSIPSFSLHYYRAVLEYYLYTNDITLLREVYPRLCELTDAFAGLIKDGALCRLGSEEYWNFYDWTENMSGSLYRKEDSCPDLMLNCLFVYAMDSFEKICGYLGEAFDLGECVERVKGEIRKRFFRADKGLYTLTEDMEFYPVLGNALAILTGVAKEEERERICRAMLDGTCSPSSLSMKVFLYDSLLLTDPEGYRDTVLRMIRTDYSHMLNSGATSAWETGKGEADFHNAGSLCHGWTAIPIYYYHKLGAARYAEEVKL